MTEPLLKQTLAIEPDLHNFVDFLFLAVNTLQGSSFSATLPTLHLLEKLRTAGAGTGYPLEVRLVCEGQTLTVAWDESERHMIAALPAPPSEETLVALRSHLQRSTETADPAILLLRNAEMARYFDETQARMEEDLQNLHQSLEDRKAALEVSIRRAQTDALTGLLNRRAYDERLDEAFRRTVRQNTECLSLVMLDLDYFKQINDEHGHQYGDEYLKKMANAMLAAIRHDVDLAFRFGGDEFAMLIFADKEVARRRALQVLAAMSNKVSIGIASISPAEPSSGSVAQFIQRADDALYQAKGAGRGQIAIDCMMGGEASWEFVKPATHEAV